METTISRPCDSAVSPNFISGPSPTVMPDSRPLCVCPPRQVLPLPHSATKLKDFVRTNQTKACQSLFSRRTGACRSALATSIPGDFRIPSCPIDLLLLKLCPSNPSSNNDRPFCVGDSQMASPYDACLHRPQPNLKNLCSANTNAPQVSVDIPMDLTCLHPCPTNSPPPHSIFGYHRCGISG